MAVAAISAGDVAVAVGASVGVCLGVVLGVGVAVGVGLSSSTQTGFMVALAVLALLVMRSISRSPGCQG